VDPRSGSRAKAGLQLLHRDRNEEHRHTTFLHVSGGEFNTASGTASSVSGGSNRTAPAQFNWAAGALFSDN
jgi:hypothetical protein